jgi:hypothetical protein
MTGLCVCVCVFSSNFEISFHSWDKILQLRYGRLYAFETKFHFNPRAGCSLYNWCTEVCYQAFFCLSLSLPIHPHLHTYLPTYYPPTHLPTYPPVYPPTYLAACLPTHPPTYLAACLPAYLSLRPSVRPSIYPTTHPPIDRSIHPSTHLPIYPPTYLPTYGSTALCWDLGHFFSFLIFYTVCRSPWKGDQPVARPLLAHRTAKTQNKRIQTSVPRVGFKLMIPLFEWGKISHVLDHAATVFSR